MLRVLPNLYLAAEKGASNLDTLNLVNVRACVNCTTDLPCYFESDPSFKYFRVPINDTNSKEDNDTLLSCLEAATDFIHENLTANIPVVLYCKRVRQSSPSVLAAYIVRYFGRTLRGSISYIQRRRPQALMPRVYYKDALLAWQSIYFPTEDPPLDTTVTIES